METGNSNYGQLYNEQGLYNSPYQYYASTGSNTNYTVGIASNITDTIQTLVGEMAMMKDEVRMFKTREMVLTDIIKELREEIKKLYYAGQG